MVAAIAAAAYAVLSIARHRTFRSTGFDLGLFDQVVWHYARLETPASTYKDLPSILRDHFSPILAALVPFRLAFGTEGLLVAQALLVSAAAIPIFAFARRRIGEWPALAIAVAYLLFGGVQEAVWFDFHEVAFAPVLIALAIERFDAGAHRAAYAASLALLLVKEDLALLVPFIALLFALQGHRRAGVALAAAGIAWFVIVTTFVTADYTDLGGFTDDPLTKARTLAYLFGAFLFLSLRSRIALLAVPLLAVRFLSDNPAYWTLEGHYSLTIAPVLALAAADAMPHPRLAYATAAVAVALTPAFPLAELFRPAAYESKPGYAQAVADIPPGAPVTATNHLAPHLSGRRDVRLLGNGPPTGYVVAALDDPAPAATFPFDGLDELRAFVGELRDGGDQAVGVLGVVVVDEAAADGAVGSEP